MSTTQSSGVYGPKYWAGMAHCLSEALQKIQSRKTKVSIPITVYRDGIRFLDLAIEAATKSLPKNAASSINTYCIATEAMRKMEPGQSWDRKDLAEQLIAFRSLLASFENELLRMPDKKILKDASAFFSEIAKA